MFDHSGRPRLDPLLQWQNMMSVDGSMNHIIGKKGKFAKTGRDEPCWAPGKKVYALVITQSSPYSWGEVYKLNAVWFIRGVYVNRFLRKKT